MSKYLHVAPIEKAQQILDTGVIDNTRIPGDETFAAKYNDGEFVLPVGNTLELIRAFVWDIEKIQESGYTRTAPWEDQDYIDMRFRHGKSLKFLPRFVHRYRIEEFRALIFDVSKQVQDTMLDLYMTDEDDGSKHYFESANHLPIEMQNVREGNIEQVCQEILGMEPPYITRRFPEGHKDVFDRNLKTESPIKYAPRGTTQK